MRVKTIKWEELKSGPGYENRRAGVEVEVADGESVDAAIVAAKGLVESMLGGNVSRGFASDAELARIEEDAKALAVRVANARMPF